MYFERTAFYPEMDPRLQYMLDRYDLGIRTPYTVSGGADEIGVIALVSDVQAWLERNDVREGATIGQTDRGWLVTATVPITQIEAIRQAEIVRSLKAAQPLRPTLDTTVPEINATARALPADLLTSGGDGVVVGIIDSYASIAHHNFRHADGSTRLIALWDQTGLGGPGSPVRYGRRYGGEEIDAALRSPVFHLARLGDVPDPSDKGGHGTHVMDIAAGNGRGSRIPGVAPKAKLIFVQYASSDLPWKGEAVVHSVFGDSKMLVEALLFIFNEAGDRPCVVNISLGTNGGPHDGSSLVERSIDTLVQARPGRAVVISASNSFEDGIHAAGAVPMGGMVDLSWSVPPVVASHSELEVWYPGSDRLLIQLLAPDGTSYGPVPLGSNGRVWADADTRVALISHRANDSNNGDNLVNLFLDKRLPSGVWTLRLYGEQVTKGGFHAWLERDDQSQSSFLPPHDSSHTLGSISCGQLSIVVGSYDAHKATKPLSRFSSAGPTRDGRPKPEVSAPGQDVWAAHSRTVTGVTRKSGTSMAAPAVTGVAALLLGEAAARGLALKAETLRRLVIEAARRYPPAPFSVKPKGEKPSGPGKWDPRYGHGRIDAAAALAALGDLATAHPATLPTPEKPEATNAEVPDLRKVSGTLVARLSEIGDDEALPAIVRVSEVGYVPEGVTRRAEINETMFTADLSRRQLANLEGDPRVVSVELSTPLREFD